MNIIGIDPGLSGAAVLLTDGIPHTAISMPVFSISKNSLNKKEIDIPQLASWLIEIVKLCKEKETIKVYIEQVGPMPEQGVTSMFSFGKSYGIILGIVSTLELPYTLIHPKKWKQRLGVPSSKEGARFRASQLMPFGAGLWTIKRGEVNQVQANGLAEAALIGYYGYCELTRGLPNVSNSSQRHSPDKPRKRRPSLEDF